MAHDNQRVDLVGKLRTPQDILSVESGELEAVIIQENGEALNGLPNVPTVIS